MRQHPAAGSDDDRRGRQRDVQRLAVRSPIAVQAASVDDARGIHGDGGRSPHREIAEAPHRRGVTGDSRVRDEARSVPVRRIGAVAHERGGRTGQIQMRSHELQRGVGHHLRATIGGSVDSDGAGGTGIQQHRIAAHIAACQERQYRRAQRDIDAAGAGVDPAMLGDCDRIARQQREGAGSVQRRDCGRDRRIRHVDIGVTLSSFADDDVDGIEDQCALLAVRRRQVDLDLVTDVELAVGAEVDQTAITLSGTGIDLRAALDGQIALGLQRDVAGIGGLAGCTEPRILADLDGVAGRDGDVARRRGLAARGQAPVDPGVVDRPDMDGAVADGDGAGAAQPLGVDGGRELCGVIEIGDIALGGAADIDVLPGQAHAVDGIDPAVDADVAIGRDRERAGHQIADRRAVDHPARADQAVGEFARRRRDVEAADVHRAGTADHEPLGIGEIDVTADRAVHVGVQRAVDVDRRVANDVDEVLRAGRQLQIDGVALPDAELRERVEGVVAGHRRRRDVGDAAGGVQGGPGAAIRNDDVRRLRLKADAEHRQKDHLHRAEQRHRTEARKPPQRQLVIISRRRWSAHFISSSSALTPIHNRVGECRGSVRHQNWPGGSLKMSGLLASAT